MPTFTDQQIADGLKSLQGWAYKDKAISKLFRFKEFLDGIEFVRRVAELAEKADHHPDIHINYTRVTFSCTTHSDGGVTQKDFQLANEIERAVKSGA